MFSDKEEFLTQTHELKIQLEESFKKIDAPRVQKSRILDQVEDHAVEGGGFDSCLTLNDQIGVLR